MGGGISSSANELGSILACTYILEELVTNGLDPRYVSFPDMYRLYDFHVGKKRYLTIGPGGILLQEAEDSFEDENESQENHHLEVTVGEDKILLHRGDLTKPNVDGWTPLHACCHTQNTILAGMTIVDEYVKMGGDLNQKTLVGPGSFSHGNTPLHIASAYGLHEMVDKLIQNGAKVSIQNSVGWTPLHDATHRGYTSIVQLLVKNGADLENICPSILLSPLPPQRPLAEACRQGHLDTVTALLGLGANKDACNLEDWTPLHEAAFHNRYRIVQVLMVHGADTTLKTKEGKQAIDLTTCKEIQQCLADVMPPQIHPLQSIESSSSSSSSSQDKINKIKSQDASKVPLSKKSEFALLGDLPSLSNPSSTFVEQHHTLEKKHNNKKENEKHIKNPSILKNTKPIPPEFLCGISKKLMNDPLKSPYGHVFDRNMVNAWFRDFGQRCPLTGQPLAMNQMVEHTEMKMKILKWRHEDTNHHSSVNPTEDDLYNF